MGKREGEKEGLRERKGKKKKGRRERGKYSAVLLHVDVDLKDGILNFNVQEETGNVVLLKVLIWN